MLKLTRCRAEFRCSPGQTVPTGNIIEEGVLWIAAPAIVALFVVDDLTNIHTQERTFVVKETPEQIMATPEMQRYLYPAMLVNMPATPRATPPASPRC